MPKGILLAVVTCLVSPAPIGRAADPSDDRLGNLVDAYSFRQWTVEDGLPERSVVAICQAGDGYLWVATSRHLLRFDGFRFVDAGPPGSDFEADPDETICRIETSAPADGIVVTTSTGLRRYAQGGWLPGMQRVPLEESPNRLANTSTLTDRSGAEWFGDDSGIRMVRDGRWFTTENGKAPVNVSTNVLAEDSEGNVWAGTDAGLVRLRRRTQGARVLRAADHAPGVRAAWIAADDTLWATAEQGGVVRFSAEPAGAAAMPVGFANAAGGLRFESILVAGDGEIWLGTDGASLWRGHPGAMLERISRASDGRRLAVIGAMAGDPQRGLWIGGGEGLFVLEPGAAIPRPVPSAGGGVRAVEDILSDDDGTLWIGRQDDQVVHIDADGSILDTVRVSGQPPGSVWALHRDRAGALWAGCNGRLVRLSDTPPTVFDGANGLPDSAITQIEDTASGVLWLGTRDGLFACDLSRLERASASQQRFLFRRLDPDGPLAHVTCTGRINKPAGGGALAGGACFPTSIGLVLLDAEAVLTRPTPPSVIMETATVSRRDGTATVTAAPTTVAVPADAGAVTLRYTAIHLAAPEAVRFRYRVAPASIGIDAGSHPDEWMTLGRDRRLVLRGLPAGRHRIEVRAGIDGKYAEQSTAVILDVETPFWQRADVLAFGATAAAAAVASVSAAVLRHRYRRKLTRALTLQRERERIARDIHDDLGAGLTHVAHLSAMAADHGPAEDPSRAMFQRIFSATTGLAQSLDEIVWAVNPANDTLDKLVSYLAEFAQEFTGAAGVACRLDLPEEVPERPVPSPVRHHVCMLLKESLHNAVTHGQPAEVFVALRMAGRSLILSIRDDGRGFDPSSTAAGESGRRSGLAAMRQRVAELGGALAIDSRPAAGTTVRIELEV